MNNQDAIINFWKEEGINYLIPAGGNRFPEGWNVLTYLSTLLNPTWPVIEVGCGDGRLAPAFPPKTYFGIDVNPEAIRAAREANPAHRFAVYQHGETMPYSPYKLLYTVLLHIHDDAIQDMVSLLTESSEAVLVAEILGRQYRRKVGKPPVFNRDGTDYDKLFGACGWRRRFESSASYGRYNNNVEITFLLYKHPAT